MSVAGSDLVTPVLLMAMPQVLDPFFQRSVVLLLHHEDEGSFGFIVNRPTGIKISEILKGMDVGWQGHEEAVAYFGGPVRPELGTVLFAPLLAGDFEEDDTATEVFPGIALTQHVGDLSRLAEAPPDH
ncbi:MAG TPA: YqgE/AlgH family protein, partial [Thermoanaerobaculia bacterium]